MTFSQIWIKQFFGVGKKFKAHIFGFRGGEEGAAAYSVI
jgi:hypothetical protein